LGKDASDKTVWSEITATPIRDKNGNVTAAVELVVPITERKKAEEALGKSEERSRAIVANSPIGIATSGSDRRFLSANDAFCRILGYTEDELRKLTVKDITCPENRQEGNTKIEALVAGSISSFVQETRYVRKDGKVIDGRNTVSAVRNQDGKPSLFIAELEDITESKARELELREERCKLEAVTQSIGAGFVVINKDFHVLWANKFIRDYKGDVEGKICYATLNNLPNLCPDCGVKKIFENGVDFDSHEYSSIDIHGKPYWVEMIATPIKDEAGNIVSAVEIVVDITEKKTLQSELAQYSMQLEKLVEERTEQLEETQHRLIKSERLAAIGESAAMVVHDLRNPLQAIKNATYYLNNMYASMYPPSLETKVGELLRMINDSVDYADKIVRDLLDFSTLRNPSFRKTDLNLLLRETLRENCKPENVRIITRLNLHREIEMDRDQMKRVFVNLITNGLQAMENGGTLTVSTRKSDSCVEVSFKDTGVGIAPENLQKLFQPFFTTKAKGMGVGLAICKKFVENHKGRINVKSKVGKGTTFTVNLPIPHGKEVEKVDKKKN
jgi:PAS domain S-box-containing protein